MAAVDDLVPGQLWRMSDEIVASIQSDMDDRDAGGQNSGRLMSVLVLVLDKGEEGEEEYWDFQISFSAEEGDGTIEGTSGNQRMSKSDLEEYVQHFIMVSEAM